MLSSAEVKDIRLQIARSNPYPSGKWRLKHKREGGWKLVIRGPVGTESEVTNLPDLPSYADALATVKTVVHYHSPHVSASEIGALISILTMLVEIVSQKAPPGSTILKLG